jgi:UPF0755 protein
MVSRGRKQKDWKKIVTVVLAILLLVLASSMFLIRREYNQNLRPASASQKNVTFTVQKGASVQEVAVSLQESGLIRSSWAFEWYFRTNNLRDYLKAGTYTLRPNLSVSEIADVITQGRIPSGQRITQSTLLW